MVYPRPSGIGRKRWSQPPYRITTSPASIAPCSASQARTSAIVRRGETPSAALGNERQSMTAAGPCNHASGTRSPVMAPAGPACGRPEPGGGTKCGGASKCVPACSSTTIQQSKYGEELAMRCGPSTGAYQLCTLCRNC